MANQLRARLKRLGQAEQQTAMTGIRHGHIWEEGFAALVRFKQREDHCRVPNKHKEDDYNLGTWVGHQRVNKDTLSPERRQRLDEIEFVWDARKRS